MNEVIFFPPCVTNEKTRPLRSLDDLILGCKAWEKAAFDELIKRYMGLIIKEIRRVFRSLYADQNLSTIMVFFDDIQKVQGRYEDRLKPLGVKMDRTSLNEMTDNELINFARVDGAVFIEGKGTLHTFKAILKPVATGDLDYDLGIGARHLSAHAFSADAECMTMVVSEDGAVTLYCDGKKICRT